MGLSEMSLGRAVVAISPSSGNFRFGPVASQILRFSCHQHNDLRIGYKAVPNGAKRTALDPKRISTMLLWWVWRVGEKKCLRPDGPFHLLMTSLYFSRESQWDVLRGHRSGAGFSLWGVGLAGTKTRRLKPAPLSEASLCCPAPSGGTGLAEARFGLQASPTRKLRAP
jgi:hypothetical protein